MTGEPLDVAALSAAVRDPRAGAVVLFEGVTREVPELEYEAYAEMAAERIARIAAEEAGRHGLCAVAVEHRTGTVPLGEPSVIVAASAPHRGEAFAGARAVIDRVKAEAPIWKVEVDGADRRRVEGTLPPVYLTWAILDVVGEAAQAIGVERRHAAPLGPRRLGQTRASPVMAVASQASPQGQRCARGSCPRARLAPATQRGPDEALGLAVAQRSPAPDAHAPDAQLSARERVDRGAVARAVVGVHALDDDAAAGV